MNRKQQTFCEEYIVTLNGSQAAIKAGYSKKTSREIARKLLTKVDIKAHIDKLIEERRERTQGSADRIVEELRMIAFSDIMDFVEIKNGRVIIKDFSTLAPGQSRIIKEVEKLTTINAVKSKVKLNDKIKALELLMRHYGMLKDITIHEKGDSFDPEIDDLSEDELRAIINLKQEIEEKRKQKQEVKK